MCFRLLHPLSKSYGPTKSSNDTKAAITLILVILHIIFNIGGLQLIRVANILFFYGLPITSNMLKF